MSVRIGELRRQTGVGLHLLRYYEDRGLLHPVRTASGYRVYRPDDVERVRQIRLLLAAGLSTAVIGEVLPCLDDTDGQLIVLCDQTRGTILTSTTASKMPPRGSPTRAISSVRSSNARSDSADPLDSWSLPSWSSSPEVLCIPADRLARR